jgi:hypothetical protein
MDRPSRIAAMQTLVQRNGPERTAEHICDLQDAVASLERENLRLGEQVAELADKLRKEREART